VPPFLRVPRSVHWAVGLPSTFPLLMPPLGGRSARYPDFSLYWGPPIAISISYGSSSSQPQGPARRGQSGLSDSIAAAIWFTGITKKSHAYVTEQGVKQGPGD
ncbi:hypothetical protein HAX54_026570, partial [Datura stramonium]|nr:hypothetical protein [Datura stramonium]